MTFKHTKFDSPTLRALEKVAVEKGLVKPEPLQKKAAVTKKADYTPTSDFMENIFKLCAGLRTVGLEKEANEIEMNYLNYKKAQTLYETSKEKGEDLVQSAHPKGSHKLEGVEGEEATFEDIIDQHLKSMKVVEKKPTGKLSTAQAIDAVKKALADTHTIPEVTVVGQPQDEEGWYAELSKATNNVQKFVTSTIAKIKEFGNLDEFTKNNLDEVGKEFRLALSERPFTGDSFRKCQEALKKLQGFAEEGDFASHWYQSQESDNKGVSLWNTYVAPHITPVISGLNKILPISKKLDEIRVAKEQGTYKEPPKAPAASPIKTQFASKLSRINSTLDRIEGSPWKSRINVKYQPKVEAALKNWRGTAASESKYLTSLSDADLDTEKDAIAGRLNALEGEITSFRKDWLKEAI